MLTGARYGALLTFNATGGVREFYTYGISQEQKDLMTQAPEGLGLLGYVSKVKAPVRVKDLASHPESVGLPKNHPPMKTFLAVPIVNHDEHVGNLYLTEKEGGLEFTEEDQHIAAMLAAQAATVICNAGRYEEEHRAKMELQALMDISPVSVNVFDMRIGQMTYMNQEAQRILGVLGIPEEEMENSFNYLKFTRTDGREIPFEDFPGTKAIQTGEIVKAEEIVTHAPNGNSITTLTSCAPLFSETGEMVSVLSVIQDMTPLEDLERRRGEFLGVVSEELRTPLTTIKGSALALRGIVQSMSEREPQQLLRIIDQQADLMRSQVNSLIELTQIEAGTLSIVTEPADVAGLIERSCGEYLRDYSALSIQLEIPEGLPNVAVDKHRIGQVLQNFLRQAAKHSNESSPVKVAASQVDIYITITVSVNGVPVSTEGFNSPFDTTDSQGIFNKISQAHNKTVELSSQGEGLALAFCRGVVEAHGGRMMTEVDEQDGRLTLTFTLPTIEEQLEVSAPDVQEISGGPLPAPPENTQILVSIDNFKMESTVRRVLIGAGYDSLTTSGLDEVEHLASAGSGKLLVMDISGREEECFRTLRRARESHILPAIVLCDRDDEEYVVRAFEMGADGYMVKPFSPSELIARIKATLRRSNAGTEPGNNSAFQLGEVLINFYERTVTVSGQPIQLTATEYKLLTELANSAGRVLTQDMLLERIWGPEYLGEPQLLRSYVKSVRQKLGDNARKPSYIFTEHGVGYRMAKPRPLADQSESAATPSPGSSRAAQMSKSVVLRNGARRPQPARL